MKAKKLECIDGETLMDMRLESIRYCVEGLLPQGVAMIGGVPKTGNLCRAEATESVSSISVMIPEVTAVTLRTAKLAVPKLPSLPFLSSLLLREGVLHNHALTQLQLRQAERPAVRRTQKAGQKPGPTFLITTEVTITANRKRNQTISIRLTPAEKKEITNKAKQAQMTLTDYLIECSRNTDITVTDLSEVLVELKRIGNNINQIAHKVNSKRFFFGNFNSVIEGQRKIYDAILNLTGDDS